MNFIDDGKPHSRWLLNVQIYPEENPLVVLKSASVLSTLFRFVVRLREPETELAFCERRYSRSDGWLGPVTILCVFPPVSRLCDALLREGRRQTLFEGFPLLRQIHHCAIVSPSESWHLLGDLRPSLCSFSFRFLPLFP